MITRTAIDALALSELIASPRRRSMNQQSRLTKVLREHGQLVWTDAADREELVAAIKAHGDSTVQKLWLQTLKYLQDKGRLSESRPSLDRPTSVLCREIPLPPGFKRELDLVVVSEAAAADGGFADSGRSHRSGEPELVSLDVLEDSDTLRQIIAVRERGHFPSGTDRDEIWAAVFGRLAGVSKEATVLDHYLLKAVLNDQGPARHVQWLLRRLNDSMEAAGSVRLLAELPTNADPTAIERRLRELLPVGCRLHVSITLAPWRGGGMNGPHDRHARFSCGAAVTVEEGFDRFWKRSISGGDGFTWSYRTNQEFLSELAERERFVLGHPDRQTFDFYPQL